MKILFLAANPVDGVTRLRIDKEIREISQKIHSGPLGDQFQLESAWAVRADDLAELLMRHQPDIVHFSGHCSPSSGIMLEDEYGNRKEVSSEALADLFRILKANIRVVVLNACYAKDQAQALAATIDFTIGMNAAIEDKDATIFAARFYQSLAFGYSVKDAFDLAVNQLKLVGSDVAHVPVLLERKGANAAKSRIVKPSRVAVAGDLVAPTPILGENSNITTGAQVMRGARWRGTQREDASLDCVPALALRQHRNQRCDRCLTPVSGGRRLAGSGRSHRTIGFCRARNRGRRYHDYLDDAPDPSTGGKSCRLISP